MSRWQCNLYWERHGKYRVTELVLTEFFIAKDQEDAARQAEALAEQWVRSRDLLGDFGYGPTLVIVGWNVCVLDEPQLNRAMKMVYFWAGEGNIEAMKAAGVPLDCRHKWEHERWTGWEKDERGASWRRRRRTCTECTAIRDDILPFLDELEPKVRYTMPEDL